MAASLRIYIQGDTPIHRADARVKLVLLLLFSVGVFFVDTWRGLGVYSLAVAAVVVAGRMPLVRLGALSLPLVVLLAFIWVCNAFAFDVGSLAESGLGGVSAGFAEGWQPVALAGTFGFVPQGCMLALFYAGSHPSYLVGEFRRFVYHIRRSVDGCFCVADATSARHSRSRRRCGHHALPCSSVYSPYRRGIGVGTQRPNGAAAHGWKAASVWQRLFAYRTVFIPLIVRLFRRADTLSVSMVARCYGCTQRTSLEEPHICLRQAVVFLACSALLVVVACIL